MGKDQADQRVEKRGLPMRRILISAELDETQYNDLVKHGLKAVLETVSEDKLQRIHHVNEYLHTKDQQAIIWSIEDFEAIAQQDEQDADAEIGSIYDRSLFAETLDTMTQQHDADQGITWLTIEHYLWEYCRKGQRNG